MGYLVLLRLQSKVLLAYWYSFQIHVLRSFCTFFSAKQSQLFAEIRIILTVNEQTLFNKNLFLSVKIVRVMCRFVSCDFRSSSGQ